MYKRQDLAGHLGKVKGRGVQDEFARLNLGSIQHAHDHAAEPSDFLGDDAQIFLLLVGRDGAVQHAVHKAADGGHRGLEFVRYVADKAAREFIELGQIARHVVKGYG